ncbi:hypothetical protein [Halomicrobium urmianum]|uniref:hypothetical protein n=1 Tax=Halomicrobium urmianum TaxID=1586233 RepID=UPI001CDA4D71|nr:hypothetical protein [Halomicrobium urmianum]
MTTSGPGTPETAELRSRSFQITVDGGRDSFFALSIEDETNEDAWLMSDTVRALENVR